MKAFRSPAPAGPAAAVAESAPRRVIFCRSLLVLTVFLLPVKFGLPVTYWEAPVLPGSGWEWLLGLWPPFLAPCLAGTCLLAAALLLPVPRAPRHAWLLPTLWAVLLLAQLPGLRHTTEWDSALLMLGHWAGVAALALAGFWVWSHDQRLADWLLAAAAAGTLLTALAGWEQYFWGFDRTLEFALDQQRQSGRPINPDLLNRIQQHRAYGSFVYPNSYAAHLILTLPLVLAAAWRAGNHFEPARLSRLLFSVLALTVTGGALVLSGSRAAILALGLGLGGMLALLPCASPGLRRLRAGLAMAAVLAGLAGVWLLGQGRALETVAARGDYWRAAVTMARQQPACGVGLGEFHTWYARLKPADAEFTRQPHAMILGMAAQAGLPAALAALGCCFLPPLLLGRRPDDRSVLFWTTAAVQAGLLAWGFHAQADFNSEIPGTVMLVALLPFIVLPRPEDEDTSEPARRPGADPSFTARAGLRLGAGLLALVCLASAWRIPGEQLQLILFQVADAPNPEARALLPDLTRATARLMPFSPGPWLILARAEEAAGDRPAVNAAWREVLRRTPHRGVFHARAGLALLATGAPSEDVRHTLVEAETWYPDSAATRDLRNRLENTRTAPER